MPPSHLHVDLSSEGDTSARARQLASQLAPGDTVLLAGAVGAGKTHFARSLIRSILIEDEDIPSPTFTLVQTYDTRQGPLWHSDLYRLSSPQEIEELGLPEAFDTAICLVEWPDRLGDLRPRDALDLTLEPQEDTDRRSLDAAWRDPRWPEKLEPWQR